MRVYENHIKMYKIIYKCTRLLDGIAFSGAAFNGTTFSRAVLSGTVFSGTVFKLKSSFP